MSDSLTLAGIQVIGGNGYNLAPGIDMGEPVPDTATIASLLLDGDRVSGDRTKNRSLAFPIRVSGATRSQLTQRVDALMAGVSAATWPVQWIPDGGLPVIFDAFRAQVSRDHSPKRDAQLTTLVTVECDALPFGRSTTAQVVAAAASQLQIDSYDTAPTGATLDTSVKYEGTGSGRVAFNNGVGPVITQYWWRPPTVSRSFAAKDLTGKTSVTVRFRPPPLKSNDAGSSTGPYSFFTALFTLTLTLSDGTNTDKFTATITVSTSSTAFSLVTFDLSAPTHVVGSGVNIAAITSYTLDASYDYSRTTPSRYWSASSYNAYYDDLRALPSASAGIATTKGQVLTVPSILGSARAPVALAASKSGGSLNSLLLHAPPGDQDADAAILIDLDDSLANQTITIATANAGLAATFALVLAVATNGAGGTNTVTVTVVQKESGTTVATQAITVSYTSPYAGKLISLGEITLPLRDVPGDNTATTYTVQVNRTAGADLYSDLALCDTRGQTILAVSPIAAAFIYVDEPEATTGFGQVLAAATDRSNAYSILDGCLVCGGPITFDPGNNRLLALSPDGAPSVTATLFPRWLDERVA